MFLSRRFPMISRLGFVLVALCLPAGAGTAHAQQSTYIGTWVNNTFGSTGSASFSGGVQGDQLVFTFDLNGNVFGQSNPPPVTLQGEFGPGSVTFSKQNDPFYGNIFIEFGFDGLVRGSFENVPGAGIDRVTLDGRLSRDSDEFEVAYTVFFSGGGGQATGVVRAEHQSGPLPERLLFAQVGGGAGFTSDVVLANPSEETVRGVVTFAGADGQSLSVIIAASNGDSATAQTVPAQAGQGVSFTIPPLGAVTLSTSPQGDLKVGSAAVISDSSLGGVIRFNLPGIGIAGVQASERRLTGFVVPVRRLAGGINTGIAVRNVSLEPITLQLSLRTGSGQVAAGQLPVPGSGHVAKFIDELFQGTDTSNFNGTLVVRVQGGTVVATALELGPNPGQFTTLPVTRLEGTVAATALELGPNPGQFTTLPVTRLESEGQ